MWGVRRGYCENFLIQRFPARKSDLQTDNESSTPLPRFQGPFAVQRPLRRTMRSFLVFGVILCGSAWAKEKCGVSRYIECMEPLHDMLYVLFGNEHGQLIIELYQDDVDLRISCLFVLEGIDCIRDYAKECGTEMIAENFQEQFEKPAQFLQKVCDRQSPLRREYLSASSCFREKADDLQICFTEVQAFLSIYEADSEEKEWTITCMYEMMLRACLISTAAEKCGIEAATFMRKALLYSSSLRMETCSKE